MSLIIDRPMCVDCIARRADVSVETIKAYIDRMRASVHIRDGGGGCRACRRGDVPVYWLSPDPDEPLPSGE